MAGPPTSLLLAAMRPLLAAVPAGPLGVAVSGGGDSTALLLLLVAWTHEHGRPLLAVTVDHRLRAESAAEAAAVARLCAGEGIPHDTLRWDGWDRRGNLQDAARRARRGLIADWARRRELAAVALGHTLDDQAETVLMRLARGSGVDGLAAMAPVAEADGVVWLRPLLGLLRADLRDWLAAEGRAWCEDPSNADLAFARIRARAALRHFAPLGLTPERLAATAARMAEARQALELQTAELAARSVAPGPAGDLLLYPAPLAKAPREIGLRLVAGALMWVSGARYRPRLARLAPAYAAVAAGRVGHGLTLHGCVLRRTGDRIAIRREPARVAPPVPLADRRWDGRWVLTAGEIADGLTIGATGAAGLAACPGWREATPAAREALLTTPAVWAAARLVSAPVVTGDTRWRFARIAAHPPSWVRPLFR